MVQVRLILEHWYIHICHALFSIIPLAILPNVQSVGTLNLPALGGGCFLRTENILCFFFCHNDSWGRDAFEILGRGRISISYQSILPLGRWIGFQTSFDALRILVATGGFNPDRWFCFTAYYSFSFPFIHSSTSKVMSILWYLCMGGRILVHNRAWLERNSSWFHKNNLLSLPSRNYFVQPSL